MECVVNAITSNGRLGYGPLFLFSKRDKLQMRIDVDACSLPR